MNYQGSTNKHKTCIDDTPNRTTQSNNSQGELPSQALYIYWRKNKPNGLTPKPQSIHICVLNINLEI